MNPLALCYSLAFGLAASLASAAHAVSFGAPQGMAVFGSALDLRLPLLADASGAALPQCAAADVFYGDNRVGGSRVSTFLEGEGSSVAVRVRADTPIDARMVIVYLHLGCSSRFTRKLVVAAEDPDSVPQSRATVAAAEKTAPPQEKAPVAAAPAVDRASAGLVASPKRAPVPSPSTQPARPRLQLGAPFMGEADLPPLRMTARLGSAPAAQASPQRSSAAALWRAVGAAPEDVARQLEANAQPAAQPAAEVALLRTAAQAREAEAAHWRSRAEQAQRGQYANPLVFGLALWSVAAGGAAAYVLMRRRRWSDWGHDTRPTT